MKKKKYITREKMLHHLLDLVIEINSLECRNQNVTDNKPTAFFEYSGHVSILYIRICMNGWSKLYEDADGYITITVKNSVDMSKIAGHWMKIKQGEKYAGYAMIKGSSEYNTKEMSEFIDGVVQEAKELGIQTETPEEIERMKQLWNSSR